MASIKLWYQIRDLGDGSSTVKLFLTEKEAWEGLDEDGFAPHEDIPYQIDSTTLSSKDLMGHIHDEGS